MKRPTVKDIDEYIALYPPATQKVMRQIRSTIKKAAPGATEAISYAIPTFKLNGTYLVYFAGYEHHIGFYPAPVNIEKFRKELSGYKQGKGSVQFPLDQPMPLELITKMVKFRAQQTEEKLLAKKKPAKKKSAAKKSTSKTKEK